ncbi:sulfatase-like hydrolase/transferase [Coraliomargarita algicola]|uniref:Sulfatase-like hydrolase/transferase n=1 Tax=Coraliomargarita algicola TaxID=3092156 RepID=A0ABZ0RP87_9BACT|nr:sulfatase-like hydrolase/transferase [Coraliomargarita sp. J2-16]WPJ96712.1 sulfatase-like hydrolase/transferase [Coraliomargarita sp. J2-16]
MNVVVFFTDQQRYDTVGLHGNPLGLTPNFDRLARAGTFLKNCFTCQPVCTPARASLQTGRYASQLGLDGGALPDDAETLATHFKRAGYDTAYIGKWHLGGAEPVPTVKQGDYAYWLAANTPEIGSDAYDCRLFNQQGEPVSLPGYRVDAQTDAAIRYISQKRENPYFLFLSFLEPHQQNPQDAYPAPDGYREQYASRWMPPDLAALKGSADQQMAGYCGMVKRLDEALGRLVDALKSTGQLENTVIVYASDHGCHFRTRAHEYKHTPHESSIRIPALIHGPGFMAGGEREETVSLVDLPATLLDAANLEIPQSMQGASILPALRREPNERHREAYVEYENMNGTGRAIRTPRWKYAVQTDARTLPSYACAESYREAFLYDLEADPWELENLIDLEGYRGIAGRLRQRLLCQIESVEGRAPTIAPPVSIRPSGQRVLPDALGEL